MPSSPRPEKRWSIASLGSRHQFDIGVAILAVIPLMAICWLLARDWQAGDASPITFLILVPLLLLATLGFNLLRKYPQTIIQLRKALNEVARGELPEHVTLVKEERDIGEVEADLNSVIHQLREKIQILEKQNKDLVDAERQRVMIESIGAACHHLGQPATVIGTYLNMMKRREQSPEMVGMIDECIKASEAIADVLQRLQFVQKYRTEPYRIIDDGEEPRPDEKILKI
jgi:signal transduction histidine kinase